ncbi:hypothetical protein FIBSPDRAFT_425073 [Athelia psychrophila]|uniref:Uncharacterized protein n=1 Tax=Athelia psychrophila TaxID=1759441 RepID=A0A167UNM1_9AGAM|nr:hypothetical protein FIBSPDRAFT_425073 [Fibularhizoctonia sp. CBS 109695]
MSSSYWHSIVLVCDVRVDYWCARTDAHIPLVRYSFVCMPIIRQSGRKMGTSMRWARAIEADICVQRTIHLPVLIGTHECALDAHNARSPHRLPSKTPSSDAPSPPPHPASPFQPLPRRIATFFRSILKVTFADQSSKGDYEPEPTTHAEHENNAVGFVRAHL